MDFPVLQTLAVEAVVALKMLVLVLQAVQA
jgi:hypothetical protein